MNTKCLSSVNLAFLTTAALALFIPGDLFAQEAAAVAEKPLVSPEALGAVSAPAKVQSGNATTGTSRSDTAIPTDFPGKTDLDDPGSKDSRLVVPGDAEGRATVTRLSKIDLDADLNYDGSLDNSDPSDQRRHETVPPGLEIGVGEVSRVLIRFKTYEEAFPGGLVVFLEVAGVNRDSASGAFSGSAEGSFGRIRVWRDLERKELLLDSGDPEKSRAEWKFDTENLSRGIPRTLYVEGVKASPKFDGDLRLLLVSSHASDGDDANTPSSLYQRAFDHMLFSVREKPVEKEFINNNVEGVWSSVNGTPPAAGAQPSR